MVSFYVLYHLNFIYFLIEGYNFDLFFRHGFLVCFFCVCVTYGDVFQLLNLFFKNNNHVELGLDIFMLLILKFNSLEVLERGMVEVLSNFYLLLFSYNVSNFSSAFNWTASFLDYDSTSTSSPQCRCPVLKKALT